MISNTQRNTRRIPVRLPLAMLALTALLLALPFPSAAEEDYSSESQLVEKARLTLEKFVHSPSMTLFQGQLKRARGILIMPQVIKGAFWFGGAGGSGVLLLRNEETGAWSDPAFYRLGAGSFGLQIGGSATESIMLVMKTKGAESFYTTSFELAADGTMAFGPWGIGTKGATSLSMSMDMVAYAFAKGAFAGLSLDGAFVWPSNGSNEAYYGKGTRPTDILVTGTATNPEAEPLRLDLTRAAEKRGAVPTAPVTGE